MLKDDAPEAADEAVRAPDPALSDLCDALCWTAADGTIQPISRDGGMDTKGAPTYGHRYGRHKPIGSEDSRACPPGACARRPSTLICLQGPRHPHCRPDHAVEPWALPHFRYPSPAHRVPEPLLCPREGPAHRHPSSPRDTKSLLQAPKAHQPVLAPPPPLHYPWHPCTSPA